MRARLSFTSGPDRAQSFELAEDLVHLGRGAESAFVLTDPTAADHVASIVCRSGRYAIFCPAEGVQVEGTDIPPEKWIWLPEAATVQLTRRTAARFEVLPDTPGTAIASGAVAGTPAAEVDSNGSFAAESVVTADGQRTAASDPADPARPRKSARGEKKSPTVARFITDGPGDPLVKLGEDGHLPELKLREGQAREPRDTGAKSSNPVLLIVALLFSFGMSIGLLFLEPGEGGSRPSEKAAARREIAEYYGAEGDALKPYQIWLRQARQARSRKDYSTERREYRRVLDLLRAEGNDRRLTGISGSKDRDARLEELISILLSD